jgi:hypothetical protein
MLININSKLETKDASFPIIHVDAIGGRLGLWPKVRKAFAYIHEHFQGQYDWVMKADDDT